MWCLETLKRLNAEAAVKPVTDALQGHLEALRKQFPKRFRELVRLVKQLSKECK
jgi:hypothetical protein